MNQQLQRIARITSENTLLHQLTVRSQQLQALNQRLAEILPPEMCAHCYLANINHQTVVIHTDNASYATRLRFQANTIFQALTGHVPHIISKLDVRVRPTLNSPIARRESLSMSRHSAQMIQATAQTLDNTALQRSLYKLARRAINSQSM